MLRARQYPTARTAFDQYALLHHSDTVSIACENRGIVEMRITAGSFARATSCMMQAPLAEQRHPARSSAHRRSSVLVAASYKVNIGIQCDVNDTLCHGGASRYAFDCRAANSVAKVRWFFFMSCPLLDCLFSDTGWRCPLRETETGRLAVGIGQLANAHLPCTRVHQDCGDRCR